MLINLYDIYISLLNNFRIPYFAVFISYIVPFKFGNI
jgi:hypothetical protein